MRRFSDLEQSGRSGMRRFSDLERIGRSGMWRLSDLEQSGRSRMRRFSDMEQSGISEMEISGMSDSEENNKPSDEDAPESCFLIKFHCQN